MQHVVGGALVCCTQIGRPNSARFFFSTSPSEFERALSKIRQKLNAMYMHVNTEITVRVFTLIQLQRRSHLSKEYPTHAETGPFSHPRPGAFHDEAPFSGYPTRADNGQVEEDLPSTGRQKVFKMEALVHATNNFQENNKVGEGGFGAVYKGTTHDGRQIAVKKMSLTSNEGRKAFENEKKLLAEVQHRNLVNLLGSCEQESQGFLVYEYFPNKSLDKFLFDADKRKELDCPKLCNIVQGIARGLLYLHEDSQVRIVHRDIKPSNILLDEKLNPKIADFGTANLFPEDRTHVTATRAVGTFGYMPPEYVMTGKFSERTDVYSFGIVLLELLTGEKISSDAFLERVWRSYKTKKIVQTFDPTITEIWDKEKALKFIQVGLLCIQEDLLRPKMSDVILMLSNSKSSPVPKKPTFQPSTARSWKMATLPWKLYAFMRAVFQIQEQRVE